ncbi:Serine [Trichuris trichiura]|uniref:Serine n=1 Tax=Trichuris trichiura TaxID=36087 RepID=A0A077Z4E9_TRITR|nr:Serine [Trichuris trichiura]
MQLENLIFDERDASAKLGRGAFGSVFRAKRTIKNGEHDVAVKKLPRANMKMEELEAIRTANNPNIVAIYDIFFQEDFCFLVMELCDSSLHAMIQQEGSLGMDNFESVLTGLASGYKALSDIGIIHRDLKPANILLKYRTENDSKTKTIEHVKIADFGCSRLADTKLNTELIGTPLYMAPEIGASVLTKGEYDSKIDMWSIGVVLYECLVGKVPFDEKALCKLFLFSANRNYVGYNGPENFPEKANEHHQYIIGSLLELDANKRMKPAEFHCLAIHRPPLKKRKNTGAFSVLGQSSHSGKPALNHAFLIPDCPLCSEQSTSKSLLKSTMKMMHTHAAMLIVSQLNHLY